ncbi:MAG: hypothetical protein NTY89_12920, partial [Nostocales cyanobacterium LacPavin_0920_SED1_MAG_38_18]|nr:hypothetical protein [Nostocales cyanobacterium LacPavin_0920_SED1_MAG_38_18]
GVSPSKATSSISTHFCANVLSLGTCANRILGLQNFKNLSGFSPESVKMNLCLMENNVMKILIFVNNRNYELTK